MIKTFEIKSWLLPAYVVATLFPRLLSLPGLPAQVQLTELLYPLLLVVFYREGLAECRRYPLLAGAVVIYCGANILAGIFAPLPENGESLSISQLKEPAARCYLGSVLFLTMGALRTYGTERLTAVWRWVTVAVSALCIIVYVAVVLGNPDLGYFVSHFDVYPYLGSVYRLRGPGVSYSMLYILLLPGMFLALERAQMTGKWYGALVICLAGVLTIGKENLLLPLGILLWFAWRFRSLVYRVLTLAAAGLIATVLLFGTHFILVSESENLSETAYSNGRSWFGDSPYSLLETNYTENKRAALIIAGRYPLLGVGPGNFGEHTALLVEEGRYPRNFGRFDPHSSWTGALAETGLVGLLALCFLAFVLWRIGPAATEAPLLTALLVCLLVTSVFTDLMNFRGLWVLLGWYAVFPSLNSLRKPDTGQPDV